VPFKATAGLHHPIRHFNAPAGFVMHGFLNVIGAAVLAHGRQADRSALAEMLADENPANFRLDEQSFAWRGLAADAAQIGRARASAIHSYGSCSFAEPVEDLAAFGILQRRPA